MPELARFLRCFIGAISCLVSVAICCFLVAPFVVAGSAALAGESRQIKRIIFWLLGVRPRIGTKLYIIDDIDGYDSSGNKETVYRHRHQSVIPLRHHGLYTICCLCDTRGEETYFWVKSTKLHFYSHPMHKHNPQWKKIEDECRELREIEKQLNA